jgi:hypothetical protein
MESAEPAIVELPPGTPEAMSPEQAARALDHHQREPRQAFSPRTDESIEPPSKGVDPDAEPLSVREAARTLDEARETARKILADADALDWRPDDLAGTRGEAESWHSRPSLWGHRV